MTLCTVARGRAGRLARAAVDELRRGFGTEGRGKRPGEVDRVLFYTVLVLAVFGLVMVYSSSVVFAQAHTGDPAYFFKRHLCYLALGLVAMVAAVQFGYQRLVGLAYPALIVTGLLLVLVLLPGIGSRAGGSYRWLRLGPFGFQPAELAKLTFIIYLACSLTRKQERIKAFGQGFLPHLAVCAVFILLLLGQPDFGSAATMTVMLFLMLFLAGTRFSHIMVVALVAVPMAYGLIAGSPYRLRRLLAFMDPWSHRYDIGYQVSESLMSFGSGGIFGVGLGSGKHKLFFVPAAHTDFIFSIVGEELGMLGVLTVLVLFGVLVWRGIRSALRAPDLFGTYLAFGLTTLIALQALTNMGVVTGLLPTKGLTLPFFSYGGSSLICNMLAAGILLGISTSGSMKPASKHAKATWP